MTSMPYSNDFLDAQRQRLQAERTRLLAAIDADEAELLSWADGESMEQDQHPADAATALTEQELDLSLIQNSRYILSEVDDALASIDAGTYGWDDEAQAWIREERLTALPWARREVEGQRRVEEERGHDERDQYSHDTNVTSL